jgi:hypothetical protein
MAKQTSIRPFAVWALIILQILLGLGALAGGAVLILAPDGSILHMPVSIMQNSPFHSFLLPGLILFTFVGIFPCAVAYSLLKLPGWKWPNAINPFKQFHWSWAASLAAGIIATIWITVEVMFMAIAAIHIVYWCWGWLIVLLTLLPGVRNYCKLKN